MNEKQAVKEAVLGTNNYHEVMRQIAVISLKNFAGYIPKKDETELKWNRNPIDWQSRKMNMGIGMLWIFYAVEAGHFTTGEAKIVWRYGQSLKFIKRFKYRNPEISTNKKLMDAIEFCIKNPAVFTDGFGDIIYSADDEFTLRGIVYSVFQMPYEIYPQSDGTLEIQKKKYREIVRLIDNIRLWVYTGSEYLTEIDKKELFTYMDWH